MGYRTPTRSRMLWKDGRNDSQLVFYGQVIPG